MLEDTGIQINKIKAIARDAGHAILDVYHNSSSFGITVKENHSPLTIADLRSNEVITNALKSLYPHIPIISEEGKDISYHIRKSYKRYWLIDPLDGTQEFIKKNGDFTVNIALIEKNKPILGVVFVPVQNDMYWASTGLGAYYSSEKNPLKKLKVHTINLKEKQLRILCSRSHINHATNAYISNFNTPELMPVGSSLKFLYIARNMADLYPRLGPTMEWDTAAAQVVLEEAGGYVLQMDAQKPLRYNKTDLLNPHFLASANINSL